MRCAESVYYNSPGNESKEADQLNSNTAAITCSENVAYSTVSSGSTTGNEYLTPCSRNIPYLAAKRATSQKEEQYEADVYEEVQTPAKY